MASFPATVVVDNPEGSLMSGSYVDYTFIASQSDNCLVVPIQAVKNVSLAHLQADGGDAMGEDGMMDMGDGSLMVPEDAIPEAMVAPMGGGVMIMDGGSSMGPSAFAGKGDTAAVCFVKGEDTEGRGIEPDPSWEMPEGFFAVQVETGLNDESNVEIKSGLNEGDEVFIGYMTNSAWG